MKPEEFYNIFNVYEGWFKVGDFEYCELAISWENVKEVFGKFVSG